MNWSIDYVAASERGIVVCGTEALHDTTPELAWGLILALCRRVVAEDRGAPCRILPTELPHDSNGQSLGPVAPRTALRARVPSRTLQANVPTHDKSVTSTAK